ncbi:MAG: PAS domain S-box protein, partial [Thermoanaerobaculia bacterium]
MRNDSTLRASEEVSRAAESRYRAFFDDSPAGFFRSSVAGQLLECNDAFARIFGYASRGELEGGPTAQIYFAASDREQFLAALRRSGSVEHFEECLRHKDGSMLFVLTAARHFAPNGAEGEPFIQGSVLDITGLREAEAALRASEDHTRDLVDHSLDLICTHDLEGRMLSVNEAGLALSGYSREAFLQMNVVDLLAPEVRGGFAEYLTAFRAEGRASGLMRIRNAAGEIRFWEFTSTLRTKGVPTPVVRGTARDVTVERRAQQELLESEA